MPALFITCGVQGAGKTTLAMRLEGEHRAVRLTADEWILALHPVESGDEIVRHRELREIVERLQWHVAMQVLAAGGNVVLDWGLWSREERDRYRSEAQALGARVVLYVVDPPREELMRRLAIRNAQRPDSTFRISERELLDALDRFQRPTPEELALFDQI